MGCCLTFYKLNCLVIFLMIVCTMLNLFSFKRIKKGLFFISLYLMVIQRVLFFLFYNLKILKNDFIVKGDTE